jgi:periplasmic divalent cation tolerance protein
MIYTTHNSEEEARRIAHLLIREKLAACANIFPISSVYWWQQKIEQDKEWVAVLKTTPSYWNAVKERIAEEHPYDVPCIIKWEVEANEAYEKWISDSMKKD